MRELRRIITLFCKVLFFRTCRYRITIPGTFLLAIALNSASRAEQAQDDFATLATLNLPIAACLRLDTDKDGMISNSELSPLSDHLRSWALALEARHVCQLLLRDAYVKANAVEPAKIHNEGKTRAYYVINLTSSTQRLDGMIIQFQHANVPFTRIDAVYGMSLKPTELIAAGIYAPNANKKRYLKPAEIGVYLSHRKVWKQILADNLDVGVVFEDDVVLPANLDDAVNELLHVAPPDWSIIYLGCNAENKAPFFDGCRPANLNAVPHAPLTQLDDRCVAGGWAYMVNRKAATNLVRNTLPISWPIDYEIKNNFVGAQKYGPFKAYCASPEIAKTGVSGGSTIGKRGRCTTVECEVETP